MKRFPEYVLIISIVVLSAVALSKTAVAHSWYSTLCCSNKDCNPIEANEVMNF